ncbi:MAG: hypothetical protein P9M13_04095, partial [Candidatus Ancaeobacter aquaticus]|nr:hypothetical protein [Candidatus Ancaeobacter aquaticus]
AFVGTGGSLLDVSVLDTTVLDLQALTLTGDLTATGAGLTQSGSLAVTGTTDITAGAGNNITLTTATNDFTGGVRIVSGNDVGITDTNALVLGNANGVSAVSGDLIAVASGAITQSGAYSVTGTTDVTAGAGNNITLTTATNDFTGGVRIVSGNDVSLRDTDAMDLGSSTISGTLTLQTGGDLTQSGALTVTGTTSITAGANDVTFSNTSNDFTGAVTVVSVKDLSLIDANAMSLGAVTSTGTVDVATLTGDLTLTGAINTTDATASAVKLNAGKSTAVGISTGGSIIINGGAVAVGVGGRATFYTGSVSGSTGLTACVGSGSGRFRYNSDEIVTNYTTALGTGDYAIYREEPTATVTAKDETFTYSGVPYSGGNGVTKSGLVNGDTSTITFSGTLTYSGTSQGATSEGTYTIIPSGYTSLLGYGIAYVNGTLTIKYKAVPSGVTSTEFNKAKNVVASLYNTISSLYSVQWCINGTQEGMLLFNTEQSEDSTKEIYNEGPFSGSNSIEAISSYRLIIDRLKP